MEAMVPMMDVRACGRPDSYGKSFNDKSMICAGYWTGVTDTCVGDSGGPLVCIDEKLQPHVAGIISWGKGCGRAHYPGVYTRVSYYLDWIKSVIRGDSPVEDIPDEINYTSPKKRKENKKQSKIVIGVIEKKDEPLIGLAGRSEDKKPLVFTALSSMDFSHLMPSNKEASTQTTTVSSSLEITVEPTTSILPDQAVDERLGVDFGGDFIDDSNDSIDPDLSEEARKYYTVPNS